MLDMCVTACYHVRMTTNYAKTVDTLIEFVNRHPETNAAAIYSQLQGIVNQHIWLSIDGEPIYQDEVTLDVLVNTALDIVVGDYAVFCMENSPDGAPAEMVDNFDAYAVTVLSIIKDNLKLYKKGHSSTCKAVERMFEEYIEELWKQA